MPAIPVGLPFRPILYSLDQIATLLAVNIGTLKGTYVFYDGRHTGKQPKDKLLARNIAPNESSHPDWRVSEQELIRWCKKNGFLVYDRSGIDGA